MPIPLGVLAVAGAGAGPVAAGNAYELLETTLITTNTASVTFANLNTNYGSTYQHLQLRIVARESASNATSTFWMQVNGDTAANYRGHVLRGNGTNVISGDVAAAGTVDIGTIIGATGTANVFAANVIDILDPFETTKFTTARCLGGVTSDQIELRSWLWRNTAALTEIKLSPFSGSNFVQYSRFSLYGLRSS